MKDTPKINLEKIFLDFETQVSETFQVYYDALFDSYLKKNNTYVPLPAQRACKANALINVYLNNPNLHNFYGFTLAHMAAGLQDKDFIFGLIDIRKKHKLLKNDCEIEISGIIEKIPYRLFNFAMPSKDGLYGSQIAEILELEANVDTLTNLEKEEENIKIAAYSLFKNEFDSIKDNEFKNKLIDAKIDVETFNAKTYSKNANYVDILNNDNALFAEYKTLQEKYGFNLAHIALISGNVKQYNYLKSYRESLVRDNVQVLNFVHKNIKYEDLNFTQVSKFNTVITDYVVNGMDFDEFLNLTKHIKETQPRYEKTYSQAYKLANVPLTKKDNFVGITK